MRPTLLVIMLVGHAALCGCGVGMMAQPSCEMAVPTDFRNKDKCICLAQEAEFHPPCSPSQQFYGLRPTCWHPWPTSGAEWRDERCGAPGEQAAGESPMYDEAPQYREELPPGGPVQESAPTQANPFHDDAARGARGRAVPGRRGPAMTSNPGAFSSVFAPPPLGRPANKRIARPTVAVTSAVPSAAPIAVSNALPQAKLTVSTATYRQPVNPPVTIRNEPPFPVAQASYVDTTAKRVELSPEERDAETLDALGRLMSD